MLLLFPSSSGGGGGGAATTNYMLMLSLTSDGPVTPPTGTNYMLMLSLTSDTGITPPPPAPDQGSPGGGISGGYFSRKRWHEVVGELEAERAAIALKAIRQADQRRAVARAAKVAAAAIEAAREAQESPGVATELRAMNRALEAAAGAKSLRVALERTDAATEFARQAVAAMIAWQDDEDDEDEAITMLLLS